ncbi:hypothetical protein CUPS4244_05770 [Campylobacter upsaliensis]|uniref:thiolase family protein n=1 Tax=Campylobacter upsaliensis TaxID=28080 RepID=UPI00214A43CB|nr:hypothetical protein [Campylobacter upsaliensis]
MAAKRIAIGSFLGSLKQTEAVELVSMLTKSLLDETGVDKSLIDELILGQVLGAGCGQNVARQASINLKKRLLLLIYFVVLDLRL